MIVSVEVGADGRAEDVTVAQSSGHLMLDAAAVEAVRRWRFAPAELGGMAIASRVEVPVRFSLTN